MGLIDEWGKTAGTWTDNPSPKTTGGTGDSAPAGRAGLRSAIRQFTGSNVRVVRAPAYGLTARGLHSYQRAFTQWAAERLLSVGADQYDDGDHQKFEAMTIDELVGGLREELADIVNYATMIDIQLQRWVAARQTIARESR